MTPEAQRFQLLLEMVRSRAPQIALEDEGFTEREIMAAKAVVARERVSEAA
jgi:hypothetical protein